MQSAASPADLHRHEVALLLQGRCRKCAEPLDKGAVLRGGVCALCHQPSSLSPEERDALVKFLETRSGVRFGLAAAVVAVSQLVLGWFPVVSSVATGIASAWIRFYVVRASLAIVSPQRRVVALWTGRIVTAALVVSTLIINELLTLVPGVGPVLKAALSAGQVLIVGWVNSRYSLWQVERERQGVAIAWWEKALLAGLILILFASTTGLVAIVFLVLNGISWLSAHLLN